MILAIANHGGGPYFYVGAAGVYAGYPQTSGIAGWKAGEWHHLAFTYSASQGRLRLYVDGAQAQESDAKIQFPAVSPNTFTIGGDVSGRESAFGVDEVRITNNEMIAAAIAYDAALMTPFANDEVYLPLGSASPGQLTYSVNRCGSAAYDFTGVPLSNFARPSTLLPTGATSLVLNFSSQQPVACAYSVGSLLPFAAMQPFAGGQKTTSHQGTVSGISPSPQITNSVYIRCDSNPDFVQTLKYRAVGSPAGTVSPVGSIWWGSYVASNKPAQAAKISLYLCPAFNTDQARSIRLANPNAIILPNVNATETTSPTTPGNVPEDYYLHDRNGNRISDWPTAGTYLLNLTKPEVADFIANYAYQVLLQSGLVYDGVLFHSVRVSGCISDEAITRNDAGRPDGVGLARCYIDVEACGGISPRCSDDPAWLTGDCAMNSTPATFRRIVTGHDEAGLAIILSDAPPTRVQLVGGPGGPTFFEIWSTRETPARIDRQSSEPAESGLVLAPPKGGTRIRVIDFPPEGDVIRKLTESEAAEKFGEMGGSEAARSKAGAPHPLMHRTQTIDYGIVLEGELTLVVDRGEATIRAGDIVIQRGTNHAWANRSNKNCRVAFVLIEGQFVDGL